MKYYVKRCVALPGDTFEIEIHVIDVRDYDGVLGISGSKIVCVCS